MSSLNPSFLDVINPVIRYIAFILIIFRCWNLVMDFKCMSICLFSRTSMRSPVSRQRSLYQTNTSPQPVVQTHGQHAALVPNSEQSNPRQPSATKKEQESRREQHVPVISITYATDDVEPELMSLEDDARQTPVL